MTDEQLDDRAATESGEGGVAGQSPQYGVGPFSIREVALGGVWLVAFVISFFSIAPFRFESVWTSGILWILTIGVPTVAVFLIGLRRLSPDGIRRVGSLGIDQFASVAFSVATVVWLQLIWETVAFAIAEGAWARTWVIWVECVLMLVGVFLTVFAPFIPVIGEDFRGRREIPAHRSARPIRPVSPRPVVERPQRDATPAGAYDPNAPQAHPGAYDPNAPQAHSGAYGAPAAPYADQGYGAYQPQATGAYEGQAPGAYEHQAPAYDTQAQSAGAYEPASAEGSAADVQATTAFGARGDVVADDPFAASDATTDRADEQAAAQYADDPFTPVPSAEPSPADDAATDRGAVASADPSAQPATQTNSVRHQAFWALAPEERDVVDESGIPMFRVGPTAWALVIEDRGEVFIVRHEDGRIGYLHEVEGVTRG